MHQCIKVIITEIRVHIDPLNQLIKYFVGAQELHHQPVEAVGGKPAEGVRYEEAGAEVSEVQQLSKAAVEAPQCCRALGSRRTR